MTRVQDAILMALAALLVVAWGIVLSLALSVLAPPAHSQNLNDLLAAAAECPQATCPPPRPQLGWDATIEVPPSGWEPGTRVVLEVRPGLKTTPPWGHCGLLSGRAEWDGEVSPVSTIAQSPDCVPVTEPGVWVGVLYGVAMLCALSCASCQPIEIASS